MGQAGLIGKPVLRQFGASEMAEVSPSTMVIRRHHPQQGSRIGRRPLRPSRLAHPAIGALQQQQDVASGMLEMDRRLLPPAFRINLAA